MRLSPLLDRDFLLFEKIRQEGSIRCVSFFNVRPGVLLVVLLEEIDEGPDAPILP